MGHKVAQYLLEESNAENERRDLRRFVNNFVGKIVVDPKQKSWTPTKLKSSNIRKVTDEIISRGQELYRRAAFTGSRKNTLNFNCSVEDIVNDL